MNTSLMNIEVTRGVVSVRCKRLATPWAIAQGMIAENGVVSVGASEPFERWEIGGIGIALKDEGCVVHKAGAHCLGQDCRIGFINERYHRVAPADTRPARARKLMVKSDHLQRPALARDGAGVFEYRAHLRAPTPDRVDPKPDCIVYRYG